MAWKPLIQTKFDGEGVHPGRIRSKDIGEVMAAVEDVIATMILNQHDQIEIKKESIVIGVSEIKQGCLELCFDTNDYSLSVPAIDALREAFELNNLIKLPLDVRKGFEKIIGFNKKYKCSSTVTTVEGGLTVFALTEESEIPYAPLIKGETVLYGEITRSGGTDSPRIQFKTLSGQTIYCDSSKKIAVEAGRRLYSEVAVKGIAEWSPEDRQIKTFDIVEILNYESSNILDAFRGLSDRFSDSFSGIESVESFVSELRED